MKNKDEYVDAPGETKSMDITIYVVGILILLIGVGIFFAVKLLRKPADIATQTNTPGIVYDAAAVEGGWDNLSPEEIAEKLNEKVAEGMINISMNTAPYFEDGTAEGNVMIVNETINNYPQKVQFVRNDTGEKNPGYAERQCSYLYFVEIEPDGNHQCDYENGVRCSRAEE